MMIYIKAPPRIDNMLWLAKLARPYPKTAGEILQIARLWNFSQGTIDFLKCFPAHKSFSNIDDFFEECEKQEHFMNHVHHAPNEFLHSLQE